MMTVRTINYIPNQVYLYPLYLRFTVDITQVRYGDAPEQRVAAANLRRYSFGLRLARSQARHAHNLQTGLRLAIAQADVRPVMTVSFI